MLIYGSEDEAGRYLRCQELDNSNFSEFDTLVKSTDDIILKFTTEGYEHTVNGRKNDLYVAYFQNYLSKFDFGGKDYDSELIYTNKFLTQYSSDPILKEELVEVYAIFCGTSNIKLVKQYLEANILGKSSREILATL